MKHEHRSETPSAFTHEDLRRGIETAHRLRSEAIHTFAIDLATRLRHLFAPRKPAAAKTARRPAKAPAWCVARDLGATATRGAGVAS